MGNKVTEVLLTLTVLFTFFCFNSCTCRRSVCRKGRTGQGYGGVPGTECQGHQTSSGEIDWRICNKNPFEHWKPAYCLIWEIQV